MDQPRKSPATEWTYVLKNWWKRAINQKHIGLLLGVMATGGVLTLRSLGTFQVWELQAFDFMMNHRLAEDPDDRIIIIGIDENDIERSQNAAVSDEMLADVIEAVKAQNPAVIGLDFFRNVPRDQGYERLQQIFRETPNLIGIEKVVDDAALAAVSG
ncbi:MAG: CHASE2 domain-containing protein, partial [Cyanobacteria bacterium J06588_5]